MAVRLAARGESVLERGRGAVMGGKGGRVSFLFAEINNRALSCFFLVDLPRLNLNAARSAGLR